MARKAVENAVMVGELVRPEECYECLTSTPTEAHHEDYSLPLTVVWLCKKCHARKHRIAA
jgi:hypothetical protein